MAMKLSEQDIKILLQCAISAALQAGKALRKYSVKNLQINEKANASSLASAVVTEADLKSQHIIIGVLEPTLEKYDLALLSEEEPDDARRLQKDFFWCIDPLDGTLPFTEGKDGYAVSIALVSQEGQSILGVVYNPPSDQLWHAARNLGAKKNGEPVHLPVEPTAEKKVHFFVDRSFLFDPRYDDTVTRLEEMMLKYGAEMSVEYVGGAVMQAITALQYPNAGYFKFPKQENAGGSLWDYAATHCIYQELGLWATDVQGHPMDLNRKDSTFMNHRGIIYATDMGVQKTLMQLNNVDLRNTGN